MSFGANISCPCTGRNLSTIGAQVLQSRTRSFEKPFKTLICARPRMPVSSPLALDVAICPKSYPNSVPKSSSSSSSELIWSSKEHTNRDTFFEKGNQKPGTLNGQVLFFLHIYYVRILTYRNRISKNLTYKISVQKILHTNFEGNILGKRFFNVQN